MAVCDRVPFRAGVPARCPWPCDFGVWAFGAIACCEMCMAVSTLELGRWRRWRVLLPDVLGHVLWSLGVGAAATVGCCCQQCAL